MITYDYVLENTVVTSSASGITQITISPTFDPSIIPAKPTVSFVVYSGVYIGTFTGTDKGTFNINISNNGIITGTAYSNLYSSSVIVNGNVSNNGTSTFGNVSSGGAFTGTVQNGIFSGTWRNASTGESGTFQGAKQ